MKWTSFLKYIGIDNACTKVRSQNYRAHSVSANSNAHYTLTPPNIE